MPVDSTSIIIVIGTLVLIGVPLLIAYRMMRFQKIQQFDDSNRSPFRWLIPRCESVAQKQFPDGWQAVFPHGGEAFFFRLPHVGASVEIEITGECQFHWTERTLNRADALYRAKDGRFVDEHHELRIDDRYLNRWRSYNQLEILESARGEHRYKIRLDLPTASEQVGIAFGEAQEDYVHPDLGYLRVRVTALSADAPSIAWRREQERNREQARKEAAEAAEQMARAVKKLSIQSQLLRNWEDPEYCMKFARVHCEELLQNQAAIRGGAATFLEQHELVEYLRRHNPSAVKTILGRLKALLEAERIALDRAIATAEAPRPGAPEAPKALPPQSQPKKKLTATEVQQLKVRRQQIALGDKVALAKDRIATKQEIKAYIQAQYPDLEEDERQAMFQEILDQIDEEEGKNGATVL